MGAIRLVGRATTRHRWRSVLAIALVVGIAGGVVLTALAGAARAGSSFDRFRAETRAGDLTLNSQEIDPEFARRVGRLPGVAAVGLLAIQAAALPDFSFRPMAAPLDDHTGRDLDRSRLVSGRAARPGRDEVVLGESASKVLDLGVGDTLRLLTFSPEQVARAQDPDTELGGSPEGPRLALEVVGIERRPIDLTPLGEQTAVTFLPRDFADRHREKVAVFGSIIRIRLQPGTPARQVVDEVRSIAGDRILGFEGNNIDSGGIEDSLGVLAIGLRLFAAIGAVAALVAIVQMLGRTIGTQRADQATLRAMAMSGRARWLAALLPVLPAAVGGALLATTVAFLASPLMPIGVARRAEPDPGLAFDGAVLGLGAVAIVVLVGALAAWAAWRTTRAAAWDPRYQRATVHPSRIAARLARAGASTPAVTGVRMTLEPGRGATAVPVRPALVAAAAGVAGLVAALVVGASLAQLADQPGRYGWSFDAALMGSGGETSSGRLCGPNRSTFADAPYVTATANVCFSTVEVKGRPVNAIGFTSVTGPPIDPAMLRGRAARTDDEVVVGETLLADLGRDIGDTIRVRGTRRSRALRVVGTATFPTLEDPAAVSEGVALTGTALGRLGVGTNSSYSHVLVRWRPDTDLAAAVASATKVSDQAPALPVRPGEVERLLQVERLPVILAAFLAGLALLAVSNAVVTNARRRRRDLAVLEVLGLRSRQVRATIAWQAAALTAVGLAAGVPLGLLTGQLVWQMVAESIGVATDAAIPGPSVALLVPAALGAALVIAWLPGRRAARLRPAAVLRTE